MKRSPHSSQRRTNETLSDEDFEAQELPKDRKIKGQFDYYQTYFDDDQMAPPSDHFKLQN